MRPLRLRPFAWVAVAVVCGGLVPRLSEILGMHLAGQAWSALRLSSPWLSQAGELLGGLLGGALVGSLQWLLLRRSGVGAGWIPPAVLAGVGVAAALVAYPPLALPAAPLAGGLAGLRQRRELGRLAEQLAAPDRAVGPPPPPSRQLQAAGRWPRAQALAAAWVALALLLPFPAWASAAFILGAALLTAAALRPAL